MISRTAISLVSLRDCSTASIRTLFDRLFPFVDLLSYALGLSDAAPLINLTSGDYRGLSTNDNDVFLGIPYAQPPVGSLRFVVPQPIVNVNHGLRDATQFGHACPQPGNSTGLGANISEDCLNLNVRPSTSRSMCDHITDKDYTGVETQGLQGGR